jgi:transposase
MPKQLNYTLTESELRVVRRAIARDKRPEVRHRATALHMLHQGMKPQEVADTLAVSLGSIYKWHARWREGGLNAVANQPKSGAPRKAGEAYWQRVGEVVEQEPSVFGYDFTVWTAERLIAHMVAETGIELSVSRFRVVMGKRGYVYRRPKHDLKSLQDPQARAAAEAQLNELKRGRLPESITSSLWTKRP